MYPKISLFSFLPPFVRNCKEFKYITDIEDFEIECFWELLKKESDNFFIKSSDEDGIKRYENMLKICPKRNDTIEDRITKALLKINENTPFTLRWLKARLADICGIGGFDVVLERNDYIINVEIALAKKDKYEIVESLLNRICPANLIINILNKLNKHLTLHSFAHSQMNKKSHYQLRNEALVMNFTLNNFSYGEIESQTYYQLESEIWRV
ncbi:MAG: YmfQ family protein [Eubacterium sp.]|jgi:hypothetical protein|nr:YmfQ family protein [Eubacterium sp.]